MEAEVSAPPQATVIEGQPKQQARQQVASSPTHSRSVSLPTVAPPLYSTPAAAHSTLVTSPTLQRVPSSFETSKRALRGLLGRSVSYLLSQQLITICTTGQLLLLATPFTAVPIIIALVDEVFEKPNESAYFEISALRTAVTLGAAAWGYSEYFPFNEIISKASCPVAAAAETHVATAAANLLKDRATSFLHGLYGGLAYVGYRVTHAFQRWVYKP